MSLFDPVLQLFRVKTANPFQPRLGDFYDLQDETYQYTPKELAALRDTRELGFSPVRVADGVAIFADGRFCSVLQVGTSSFGMFNEDETTQQIGGYHAVLNQLAAGLLQFKVRLVEASLEPLIQQIDYALSGNPNLNLHRLAINQKQFYRELVEQNNLVQRRNYVIISLTSARLVAMEAAFCRDYGRASYIFNGRANTNLASKKISQPKELQKHRNRQGQTNLTQQKAAYLARNRQIQEHEQLMLEELRRTQSSLQREVEMLSTGLSASGLRVSQLSDWELMALFAEYLRPELSLELQNSGYNFQNLPEEGFLRKAAAPFSLTEFIGQQSNSYVVSDQPENSAYLVGMQNAQMALSQRVDPNKPGVTDSPQPVNAPVQDASLLAVNKSANSVLTQPKVKPATRELDKRPGITVVSRNNQSQPPTKNTS